MQVTMNSFVDETLRILSEEVKDLAISMLDATGNVIKWDKIAEGITGYRAHDILGKHFSCLYSMEDPEDVKVADALGRAETEGRFEVEGWRYRKDGHRFWARVVIRALRDKDGNLVGFSKVTRDLSNRIETEAENERLASFPQLNPNPVFELDANGKVTFCNGAMKEILKNAGYGDDVNPFLPKNLPEILHAIKKKKALQYTQEIELNGLTYEERIYLAPQFEAIRIYATNITARKLAEERLRESTEKYQAIVEAFEGLIYICSDDYRIEFMNENLIKRTGKNAVGEFCYKALHDRDSVCPWCVNERVYAGETVRWEVQSPKDERWYYVVNAPIQNVDGSISKQSMIMDITESKQAGEKLRQAKLIVEKSPAVLFRWSAAEGWPVEMVSRNISQFGYTMEELLSGKIPYSSLVYHEDLARVASEVEKYTCLGEDRFQQEYRVVTKDGAVRWIDDRTVIERDTKGRATHYQGIVIDITERKRMEEELRLAHEELEKRVTERTEQLEKTAQALRTSEERYALAVQGSNDGIWDRDFSTGEVYYSSRWKSMLGYEDDELPNDPEEWKKRIHPDDYQMVMDALVGYMEGRNPSYEVEYRLRHRDGSYRYILARGICLRDSHGLPYRFSGSHTDVTDKRRAEDALKQSEEYFRQVVEHSPVAMGISTGIEQKIILLNRKHTEMFGYTLEDIPDVGRWWSLAYPDERYRKKVKTEWESNVELAINNKHARKPFEAMATCKDGSIRHIEINLSVIGERNLVAFVDHTEIKRAQEVIRQSEKRYRRLFEKSNDTIFISDPERRIIDINQVGVELFGYSKEELFSLDLEKLYCNREDRDVLWQKLHRSGFLSDHEVEMQTKDGKKIIARISMSIVKDDAGQVSGYQGIIRDVTARKRLERQLLQSQKMESVGILAGGVAHDFNNLLTAISGYGQILLESIPENDELSQDSITHVLKAADRAAELTRGLLAFSRKQLISPKPVHIDTLISDTSKLIQRVIGEDIEFSTKFSGKKLLVKADPGQMEQVLMNLATNARDAMPHGGRLSVTTRQVVVKDGSQTLYDLPSPGKYALITVADTGMGIDKRTLESIFEPFYTTKEVGKGTGLGLAIVHGIIKQHNGSVLASSEPGKGTTFNIYLPLIESHAIKEESKISMLTVGGKETLLIAEDEEIVRMFVKNILERAGYKVIIADNGEDAVARFREHDDISLVLSDVVMPRKNGKEMLDEIRKIKPGVKALFISGYAADVIHNKGILEKDVDFMTKPYSKADLLRKIRIMLDKD
jgi:PAS domain S-box-containing protein